MDHAYSSCRKDVIQVVQISFVDEVLFRVKHIDQQHVDFVVVEDGRNYSVLGRKDLPRNFLFLSLDHWRNFNLDSPYGHTVVEV